MTSTRQHLHSISGRRVLLRAAGAACAAVALPRAFGQGGAYPDRPVRIIVPSSPGGSLDSMARIVAQRLGERWRQSVVVENKPGANFAIGASYVAKAAPDGYTLLYAHDGLMAKNPAIVPKLSYNPLTELAAVGRVVDLVTMMFVTTQLPYATFPEFLAAMRAQPRTFNHAAGGPSAVFVSEYFKSLANVEYVEIPYKGAGPAMNGVAAGECHFTFTDAGSAAALVAAGRLKPFATGAASRMRLFPAVPAIAEQVPGFDVTSWSGLVAPARTPEAVIQRINADLHAILAQEAVKKQVETLGLEVNPSTPQELANRVRDDIRKWSKLVKERNLVMS